MSKRYGRNQKRKHREEIARLDAAVCLWIDHTERAQAEAQRLRLRITGWAHRIRKVCGEDHPFNEAIRKQAVRRIPTYREGVRTMPPLKLSDVLAAVDTDRIAQAATYIDCAVHELDYRQRPPEGIAGAIFELIGPDGSSALAVDRRYLLEALDDPEFERWTAQRLIDHLKGERAVMRKPRAA